MTLILGQDHGLRGELPQRTSLRGPAQRCVRITFGHVARTTPLGQPRRRRRRVLLEALQRSARARRGTVHALG
jgi:hypothetical protein